MKYLLLLILVMQVKTVYGYVDPGTGSYLLQLLIAGIFGGLYLLKSYWGVIKSYFRSNSSK